ncbi:MAG: hypothetical protein NXI27_20115 [Alphaproteobacteria bacterium]|nr:hypothetical protein [Alphaproteobacteria bacterium]
MKRTVRDRTAILLAASAWVFGPVLLKYLATAVTASVLAFTLSSAVLLVSLLCIPFTSTRPTLWRRDFLWVAWGMAMFGAAPAMVISGIVRTDIVSVVLVGGLSAFVLPGLAWLCRRKPLDSGFPVLFVLAAMGSFPILYGRVRWHEATAVGDLLLISGILFLASGFIRHPLRTSSKQPFLREVLLQIAGAALIFAALAGASAWTQFQVNDASGFTLLGILAASLLAFGCSRYWSIHTFDWRTWPVLSLAAFLPVGIVLGMVSFDVSLDSGEVITLGLLTIVVAAAHWMRRWLAA